MSNFLLPGRRRGCSMYFCMTKAWLWSDVWLRSFPESHDITMASPEGNSASTFKLTEPLILSWTFCCILATWEKYSLCQPFLVFKTCFWAWSHCKGKQGNLNVNKGKGLTCIYIDRTLGNWVLQCEENAPPHLCRSHKHSERDYIFISRALRLGGCITFINPSSPPFLYQLAHYWNLQ